MRLDGKVRFFHQTQGATSTELGRIGRPVEPMVGNLGDVAGNAACFFFLAEHTQYCELLT